MGSPISFSPSNIIQQLLALDLRQLPQIAVAPEQVEGVIHQAVLAAAGEFGLEF